MVQTTTRKPLLNKTPLTDTQPVGSRMISNEQRRTITGLATRLGLSRDEALRALRSCGYTKTSAIITWHYNDIIAALHKEAAKHKQHDDLVDQMRDARKLEVDSDDWNHD